MVQVTGSPETRSVGFIMVSMWIRALHDRNVRPVLLIYLFFFQTPEELDDSDFATEEFDNGSRTSVQTEDEELIAGQTARVRDTHTHTHALEGRSELLT